MIDTEDQIHNFSAAEIASAQLQAMRSLTDNFTTRYCISEVEVEWMKLPDEPVKSTRGKAQ